MRANDIVIRLKRGEAIAVWRSAIPDAHSLTDRQILCDRQELLQPGETLIDDGEHLILSVPIRARFRGGAATMTDPAGKAAPVGLTLNLAFLSPTLTRAIMRGEQPPGLRLNRLLRDGVPLSWREQELAFLPNTVAREKQGM